MTDKPGMEREEPIGGEATLKMLGNGAMRIEQPGGKDGVWLNEKAQRTLYARLREKYGIDDKQEGFDASELK